MKIIERSSVSGSLVETAIGQSSWNVNNMDGNNNNNYILDPSKNNLYWINMEWSGVGNVDFGVNINGKNILMHRFRHANLLNSAYITTASLKHTYEIISIGGSGSMTSLCQSVLCDGENLSHGKQFSANMGTATQIVSGTIEPLICLRIKAGKKINAILKDVSVVSTSGANALVEIWKFNDTLASTVLNNTTFISANDDSDIEYNIDATNITTTNGYIIRSVYISNNNDHIVINQSENEILSESAGISDLIVVCSTTIGFNENMIASASWTEKI
jgi:hypothetical protein